MIVSSTAIITAGMSGTVATPCNRKRSTPLTATPEPPTTANRRARRISTPDADLPQWRSRSR